MRTTFAGLLAAIVGFSFAQTALAADMPVKMPAKVAPVAVPFSWTGLYAGLDAGYARSKIGMTIVGSTAEADPKGFTFGGHLSYLYQFNNPIVIGAEGDISWLDGDATGPFPTFPSQGVSASQKWDASVRGVLGAGGRPRAGLRHRRLVVA